MKIINFIKLLQNHNSFKSFFYKKHHEFDQTVYYHQDLLETVVDQRVSGKITSDSRAVGKGDIFVCISGFTSDGHAFAKTAEEKGASLIIAEKQTEVSIPQIIVYNSRLATALFAKFYYDNPSSKFTLIGITGTNGKTTTATLIANMLLSLGKKTGMIGTTGYYINGIKYESERTTPDILDLNAIFCQMIEAGVEYVVMEVSSHALALHRVYGLEFDIAVFTNLSQDHLDFHKTMKEYAETKLVLFKEIEKNGGVSIINVDDKTGKDFFLRINSKKIAITQNQSSLKFVQNYDSYYFNDIKQSINGSQFLLNKKINNENIVLDLNTRLSGQYNLYNLVTSLAVIDQIFPNLEEKHYSDLMNDLKGAKGRLERVENELGLGIFVDYAHSPDALENVLITLKELKKGRLITIFGAGGDRDREKRPLMGLISVKYSDLVFITTDNPRSEDPDDIIREIVAPLKKDEPFWIISDRRKAIESAVMMAKENDIILIAGKGHETYQEIRGVKQHFDDFEEAESAIVLKKESSNSGKSLSITFDILNLEKILDLEKGSVHSAIIENITTDSREAAGKSLFIGIKGEKFDGSQFASKVLEIADNYAIVNKERVFDHKHCLRVDDPLTAYGLIASKYFSLFNLKKIGLTGSTGKTTTKEYLKNVLSVRYNVLSNIGNENNQIGVPRTLLNVKTAHEVAVIEMGTNHFGEIEYLARMVKPHIGIITNIGPSHLEYLINEQGVYREKKTLFDHTSETVIYPDHDPLFDSLKLPDDILKVRFGFTENADEKITIHEITDKIVFSVNQESYTIPENVEFKIINATISIIVGKMCGLSSEEIQQGLNEKPDAQYRMKIETKDERILLIDCYNANPYSMKYALQYWQKSYPEKKHYCILGDMLELGEKAAGFHEEIGVMLKELQINEDQIISVGNLSRLYKGSLHFNTIEDLLNSDVPDKAERNSVILIKGSHGIHLEKIIGRI